MNDHEKHLFMLSGPGASLQSTNTGIQLLDAAFVGTQIVMSPGL